MSREEILKAVPHRGPMLLVDEIVERGEDRIVCRKTFRREEFFFNGHYPDYPLVPGVILCECCMQAGAVLLSRFVPEDSASVPVATRINNVRLKQMIRPGDTIVIEVQLRERLSDAFFLDAKATCGGKVAVRFDFACTLAAP